MGTHRRERIEPRYGRIALALLATLVTGVSGFGGLGVFSSGPDDAAVAIDQSGLAGAPTSTSADPELAGSPSPSAKEPADPSVASSASAPAESTTPRSSEAPTPKTSPEPTNSAAPTPDPEIALPAGSGVGRRVVFSEGRQRVWLVDQVSASSGGQASDRVQRTYPVSGSSYDNLEPGTFEVYSRSENAWGIDDSGTMQWFVRFTKGTQGAAIGFHDIPVDGGAKVQTIAQLGTPLSHGCVRQATTDAKALWSFAPLGTTVVVTA